MHKKLLFILLTFILFMSLPLVANAATITACTLDKEIYYQGKTGHVKVTIYNDKDNKIRVTELTASIDYFYTDSTVYMQTFFTNATLPVEIAQGQSNTFYIPFSLPTNIASGYTKLFVRAKTELWNVQSERWFTSDQSTYQPVLYIESPYKQQLEQQQALINLYTLTTYVFGAATVVFVLIMVFLLAFTKRAKAITQPPT